MKHVLLLAFLMQCVASIVCRADPVRVIDLTEAPRSATQGGLRMPGASYGSGGRMPSGPVRSDLPITIKVDSVSIDDQYINLQVLLKNVGHEPFVLPVGRDSDRIHQDGNANRRTFLWLLGMESSNSSTVIASTVSSSAFADSYIVLKPQEAIRFKLKAHLPLGKALSGKDQHIFVTCKEWNIDDRAFVIDAESALVKASPVIATKN